jgi:parallel beta-helix repeat protein
MRWNSFIISTFMLLAVGTSHAETISVSGNVSGTWSADTVLVVGEVRVPPGQVLYIQPGVEVLFQVYCKLIVDSAAALIAIGTETDSIRFDEYSPGINWHGIRFIYASDSSKLKYCQLRHGWASGSGDDSYGGGIYCYYSNPLISNCLIDSCSCAVDGGGIICDYSSPIITGNVVSRNWADDDIGGIFCNYYSDPVISDNIIIGNASNDLGGGLGCSSSNPLISGNIISDNFCISDGAGIYLEFSDPIIINNTIIDNISDDDGGGIVVKHDSNPTIKENLIANNRSLGIGGGISGLSFSYIIISDNLIIGNSAGVNGYGGGLYLSGSYQVVTDNIFGYNFAAVGGGIYATFESNNIDMRGNSIAYNTALRRCGGAYLVGGSGAFYKNTVRNNNSNTGGGLHIQSGLFDKTNMIVRGNSPSQIGGLPTVSYSNIEGGYPGAGNIDEDPLFATVAQPFSEILWGSPCIDVGNPDPMYLDPDTTRSDMGACFYDQGKPVRMLATPYDAPNLIPAAGGDFELKLTLSNHTGSQQPTVIYCDITLPGGSTYGPVIGPINYIAAPNSNISRIRTQGVPAVAPMGVYHYNAYAVMGTDTSMSSFIFGKLGVSDGDNSSGWNNSGDPFEGPVSYTKLIANQPTKFSLEQNHPNPFNPFTTIEFSLPVAGMTKLTVFDLQGRRIASLIDSWYPAGDHEVVFDGSDFSTGIYLYRLEAGDFTASGKMVLLK